MRVHRTSTCLITKFRASHFIGWCTVYSVHGAYVLSTYTMRYPWRAHFHAFRAIFFAFLYFGVSWYYYYVDIENGEQNIELLCRFP